MCAMLRDAAAPAVDPQQLAASAERYRQVVENLGEGMGIIQNGVTVYVNPRAMQMLERTEAQMVGHSFLEWVHPDDHALVADRQMRRQRGEVVAERYDLRCITGSGAVRWMSTKASALVWEGQPATMTFFTDVTEQRAVFEALQVSESRYRTVVDRLGEGMMVIRRGVVLFANPQAAEVLGRQLPDLLQRSVLDVIHPEDRDAVAARMRARDAGQPVDAHTEFRIVLPGGEERWLATHSAMADWEGQPATLTFFTDNTEQRRMLDALHRSEERYRLVVEHVGEAMVVVQHDRFVFANQRAAHIVEMELDDMLAHGYLHRIHPEDRPIVAERRKRRLAGETEPTRYEIRLQMADGRVKWIDIGVTLVPWEGGGATLTFFSDVTERKKLEARLTQTLAERETILNSSMIGIASLTPEGRFKWANPAMLRIFGGEQGGGFDSIEPVYLDRAQYLEVGSAVAQAVAQGRRYETELQMRRLDGQPIWVALSGQAIRVDDLSQGTVWTVQDVTQRKQAEEDIRAALEQQRELNDLRSRFVAMTSHEFRTPLATILSSAELLRFYGQRMNEADRTAVITKIESSVQRMTHMLDRVLMLGRTEAGMMEFRPEALDLVRLCGSVLEEARAAHGTARHQVRLAAETPVLDGQFDEKLVRHVLGNLLGNAIKYSPEGGDVVLRVRVHEGQAELAVEDQGIGIPPAEIPHLFTSFHRASNVGEIKGTGLGLAIVKRSVDLHRGAIAVDSAPGAGTRFTVRLPLGAST